MSSYTEKLRDPKWQKVRLEVMQRDEFACRECGRKDATLTVHHQFYAAGKDPWAYPQASLVTLCEPCHGKVQVALANAHMCLVGMGLRELRMFYELNFSAAKERTRNSGELKPQASIQDKPNKFATMTEEEQLAALARAEKEARERHRLATAKQ